MDNGTSMHQHWDKATSLLETLGALTEGLDNDGIDLRFTLQDLKLSGERHGRQFVKTMELAKPKASFQPRPNAKEKNVKLDGEVQTDIAAALSSLYSQYKNKLKKSRNFARID